MHHDDKVGCVFLQRHTRRNHLLPEALTRDKPLSMPLPFATKPSSPYPSLLYFRTTEEAYVVLAAAWAPKGRTTAAFGRNAQC